MDCPRLWVVFFDLEGVLGWPRLAPRSNRLVRLEVLSHVPGALAHLRLEGLRLGVISNTPEAETQDTMKRLLEEANIYSYFDSELLIYSSVVGHRKDSPEVFKMAVVRAGLSASPSACLYVGVDFREQAFASEAGMQAQGAESFWRTLKSQDVP